MREVGVDDDELIAVVDDDESLRQALRSLLRAAGFQVHTFPSAEDFRQCARLRNTRCLILDLRMPGMGGLALQQWLAAHEFQIPIIIVTAHGDDAMRRRAVAAGAVALLPKPFSEGALLDAVETALGGGRR